MTEQRLVMRRYQPADLRGRWFVDHDNHRHSRRWANWLLKQLDIRPTYGRPKRRSSDSNEVHST